MGFRTAQAMQRSANIKIIEIDKNRADYLAESLSNTLIINADGRDIEMLKEEGLGMMDVFIGVTGNSYNFV